MSALTHFDGKGNALMVDVSDKPVTGRTAVAVGKIKVCREIFERIKSGSVKKVMYWEWQGLPALWGLKKPVSLSLYAIICR